ncbi:MAG: hypothetical protein V4501_06975 [Pseudomonadota bacterium]
MAITLKMLVEKARLYYQMMEVNRRGITLVGLVTTPTTKLFVFDQLLEQYNTDPESVRKYVYKDKKPDHTPDQVVAEIIEKVLTLGLKENEVEVMKMQISTPSSGPSTLETFLKILDNCAKVTNRSLSVEQAKNNIAELSAIYQSKMSTLDTRDELLTQANTFLDQQAVLIAHQEEIDELKRQHQQQLTTASAVIGLLYSKAADHELEIDDLNADGEELYADAEEHFALYEAEIQRLNQEYHDLQANRDALKFRLSETNADYQKQLGEVSELLTRYSELQVNLTQTEQTKNQFQHDLNSLMEEFGIVSKKLADTTDYNMRLGTMADELATKVEQAHEDLKSTHQKLTLVEEEKAQLAPQIDELLSQVTDRDEELAGKNQLIKELTAQISKLTSASVKAAADKKGLQEALMKATKLLSKVQDEYQHSADTVIERNATISALRAEIDGLHMQIEDAQQRERASQSSSKLKEESRSINGYNVDGRNGKKLHGENAALLLASKTKQGKGKKLLKVVPLASTSTLPTNGRR